MTDTNDICAVCGTRHTPVATEISTGRGIAGGVLNNWLKKAGYGNVLLIADINTSHIAHRIKQSLTHTPAEIFICGGKSLVPDETAVERLLQAIEENVYGALIAAGSGTLSDLTRFAAHKNNIPFYTVATAASMDGYTSSISPLIKNGLKLTFPASAPLGVIGDEDILETAPPAMASAGFGDITGKFTSVLDWELEYIMTGGRADYCEKLASDMRAVVKSCRDCKEINNGAVIKALLESGLVMQRAGHSKPASGSEHHLSHFWEMMALSRGEAAVLHGAKVGVAALISLRVYEWLAESAPDWAEAERRAERFNRALWHSEIRRVYGGAAEGILSQWPDESAENALKNLETLRARWGLITAAVKRGLPSYNEVKEDLLRMGCPVSPTDIGINKGDFLNGVLHAQRIRPRFTIWRAADILGLLPEYAARLADEFYQ